MSQVSNLKPYTVTSENIPYTYLGKYSYQSGNSIELFLKKKATFKTLKKLKPTMWQPV